MAQAPVRRRFGLRRFPVVTAVAFGVTAVTSVLGLADPDVLAARWRAPEGLHGDWWRTVTALFVQDGGVPGTLSNLFFLLVMGALAEQVAGRWRWLVAYLGAGLIGELAGYAWQPRRVGPGTRWPSGRRWCAGWTGPGGRSRRRPGRS
jgi:membrane associated rhomboid family serine protease